ncbi:hypothetical protein D770_26020 [Flammeovirgaceae bacterium 311]|nr:hypothetical protein D770_26020 [Flammeovirgaceae bacterium 311]
MQDQQLKELYRTLNGCIYQDNLRSVLVLEWYGRRSLLKLPCFFSLKKLAAGINIELLLTNTSRAHDVEILTPCGCDRCFVLTVMDVLEFQDLLNGTRAMMELNSILHERLRRTLACV